MTPSWSLLFPMELSAVGSRHPGWWVTLLDPGSLIGIGRKLTAGSRVCWDEWHGWLRFGRTLPAHCQWSDCSLCTCPIQHVIYALWVCQFSLSYNIKVWKTELGWSHEEELIIKKERGLISSILFIFTKNTLNYISIHRVHSFIQRFSERKDKDKNNVILQRCRKPSLEAKWLAFSSSHIFIFTSFTPNIVVPLYPMLP